MSNKLNIMIVEDELLIAEMLKETLKELNCNVVAIAKNYEQAFNNLIQFSNIDFIFLDINLSDQKTGLDVAQRINEEYKIPFIFLTSYSDPTTIQNAASYQPQGYLIKPFTKSDLLITLELYKSRNAKTERKIDFKDGLYKITLKYSDILWVKTENIYIEIITLDKKYVIRKSLAKFLEKVDDNDFIKIHRSYVVNLIHVKAFNRQYVIMQREKLPISRKYYDTFLERFSLQR
jgi:DNA-binding LytR/AlgR family response regulator